MNPTGRAPQSESERIAETATTDIAPSSPQRAKAGLPRRTRWLLGGLAVLGLLALVFWRPIQRQCLTVFLLRSDAPSSEVLSDVIEQTSDPKSLLLRLWQTQRIPHRRFALSYLGRIAGREPSLSSAMEEVLVDATTDADITARELAFATLARTEQAQLLPLALEQLKDADPAARLLGLQSMRSIANSNEVPVAMRLLSDPDARVVVAAALVLRQAAGQDFGIKSSLALPRFTSIDKTNPASPPDLAAINQGVQRWREWWNEHQVEYPAPPRAPRAPPPAARLAAPDFSVADSDGRPVRLSDYHGKVVLLTFWTWDAPVALEDTPALNALQSPNVAVLGICIPPAPSCANEHQHDQHSEHAHHHHEATSPASNPAEMHALIQRTVSERNIRYPMLVDSKGTVGLRFGVEDLPTYVLIDAQGMIRRVFAGNRTQSVLEAMVEELTATKTSHNEMP